MTEFSGSSSASRQETSTAGFGLHQLRRSNSDTTVIFVHGILSNSDAAWGNPSWPSLLLEEDGFEEVGLYVFTYRTGIRSRTYSVSDATDALLEYFSEFDIWDQGKIVFVCHSMGGIVVRRFIVANQARLARENVMLGLFLVASPSLGSSDASTLSLLSYAFQHNQAAILRFSQSNTTLDDLHRDFRKLLASKVLDIVGRELIEDRPIKIKRWLGLWRQVVEPFSASAYFHGEGYEPLRIPGSDHSSIVKPLCRTALQHRALVRFLRQFSKAAPDPETIADKLPPIPLAPGDDEVFRAALSIGLMAENVLPSNDGDPKLNARIVLKLSTGRMIERMFASALVKNYVHPNALFMAAAELATTERQFNLIAPWLRWVHDNRVAEEAENLFEKRHKSSRIDKIRMRVRLLGWSGKIFYPYVDWRDLYEQEKFAYVYFKAYAHAAWSDQGEDDLRSIVRYLIEIGHIYSACYQYDISRHDWIAAFNGIPPSNAKILLNEMVRKQAPSDMILGLLARMSVEPARDAVPDLAALIRGEDLTLRLRAMEALAFTPVSATTTHDLKQNVFEKGSIGDIISAGADLRLDTIDDLGALVVGNAERMLAYNAAWSLGQLAPRSADARRYLGDGARNNSDALVRALCVVGLAASGAAEAPALLETELADSRDIQKFCLLIARTYTEDITQLLRFLAETSEDRVYVPQMLPCFQLVFRDALRHAAQYAPVLDDLLNLSDDN